MVYVAVPNFLHFEYCKKALENGSCYFSKDVYKELKGDNKKLMIIPDAVHTDLYDQMDIIPFDKMSEFFKDNLK